MTLPDLQELVSRHRCNTDGVDTTHVFDSRDYCTWCSRSRVEVERLALLDECQRLTAERDKAVRILDLAVGRNEQTLAELVRVSCDELARYRTALLCPRCGGTGRIGKFYGGSESAWQRVDCPDCESAAIRRENAT